MKRYCRKAFANRQDIPFDQFGTPSDVSAKKCRRESSWNKTCSSLFFWGDAR